MARDRVYIPPTLWHRPAFRALHSDAQRLYLLLLSHPELKLCGVLDWRTNRLATYAADTTAEHVEVAGKALAEAGLLLVDEVTEEALVRRFVRDDGLLKQPNLATAAARQFATVTSARLREAFLRDLHALHRDEPELKGWGTEAMRGLLDDDLLPAEPDPRRDAVEGAPDPFDDPSDDPSVHPSDDPSGDPSDDPSGEGDRNPSDGPSDDPCPTSSKQLATSRKPQAAAAAAAGDPLDALRAGLEAVRLVVRWDKLAADDRAEILRLLDLHGVARLVASAQRDHNPNQPAKYAQAWLNGWQQLTPPRTDARRTTTSTAGGCPIHPGEHPIKCPQCARTGKAMPSDFRARIAQALEEPPEDDTDAPDNDEHDVQEDQ